MITRTVLRAFDDRGFMVGAVDDVVDKGMIDVVALVLVVWCAEDDSLLDILVKDTVGFINDETIVVMALEL